MFNLKNIKTNGGTHIKIISALSSTSSFEKFKKTMGSLIHNDNIGLILKETTDIIQSGHFFLEFADHEDGLGTSQYPEKLEWLKDLTLKKVHVEDAQDRLLKSQFSEAAFAMIPSQTNELKMVIKHLDEEIVKAKKHEDHLFGEIKKLAGKRTALRKADTDRLKARREGK